MGLKGGVVGSCGWWAPEPCWNAAPQRWPSLWVVTEGYILALRNMEGCSEGIGPPPFPAPQYLNEGKN